MENNNTFDPKLFQTLLQTKWLGRFLNYRLKTDTTMRIAVEQLKDGAIEGTVILAEWQTSGRGRVEGRTWESLYGKNILVTLLFRLSIQDSHKLHFAVTIAVAYACRLQGLKAWIKWPNDVWIGSKKVYGMLIDVSITGEEAYQSVGIGININEDMSKSEGAGSLFDFLGYEISREIVLADFCNKLEQIIALNIDQIIEEYKTYDKLVGNSVIVMPKKKGES